MPTTTPDPSIDPTVTTTEQSSDPANPADPSSQSTDSPSPSLIRRNRPEKPHKKTNLQKLLM